jgi:hypothetical protein
VHPGQDAVAAQRPIFSKAAPRHAQRARSAEPPSQGRPSLEEQGLSLELRGPMLVGQALPDRI